MDKQHSEITDDTFLGGKLSLFQPKKGFRAGLDSVLLAASINAQSGDKIFEIGAGVGVVLFCLMQRVSNLNAKAIEINEEYYSLLAINAKRNKFKPNLLLGDFWSNPNLKNENFDHIFFNPPYYPFNSFKSSNNKLLNIANFEYPNLLKKMLTFSLRRCKSYGYITLIHRPAKILEILSTLSSGAGDIKILPILGSNSKNISRIIIRARKSAKGETKFLRPLNLYQNLNYSDKKKHYTSELQDILKNGGALSL